MTIESRTTIERAVKTKGPRHARRMGAEANARLTSTTAFVLVILLAIEGVTVLRVRSLLTLHVFIGMLLVPPVLVKLASTLWRFTKYYMGSREYRLKGPPPIALRVLGPFVALLTVILFLSGILLLVGPQSWRGEMLTAHQASFVLWFGAMTIHVLAHAGETARTATRDWARRTRRKVAGSTSRRLVTVLSLAVGVVLALWTAPHVGPWLGVRR